jgi:hypothetical protein
VGLFNDDLQLPDYTLVEHWDGTAWSVEPSPNGPRRDNNLWGVAARDGIVWAVGKGENKYDNNLPWDTLVLREFCSPPLTVTVTPPTVTSVPPTATGTITVLQPSATMTPTRIATTAATATSTPTTTASLPTNTVVSLTATSTQSTLTPGLTATVTPCAISFADVPPSSTFYSHIRCLACRGIISGYSDGTFRPNNEVTRGQLAKIVSNAAGFTESPDPQIFEDVAPDNTFYQWINRLTRRGYMSGYVCGGPGEPCTAGRPYFRPFANATRGQTSKIVSNAAGFAELPTEQTYQDVPLSHTFYREIQRLASRNVMTGYPCGGPGEPCLSGKPYFRPENNVTRGQSAKIVSNTFFPGCVTP